MLQDVKISVYRAQASRKQRRALVVYTQGRVVMQACLDSQDSLEGQLGHRATKLATGVVQTPLLNEFAEAPAATSTVWQHPLGWLSPNVVPVHAAPGYGSSLPYHWNCPPIGVRSMVHMPMPTPPMPTPPMPLMQQPPPMQPLMQPPPMP